MSFYSATLSAGIGIAENGCACAACRFGHGARRPARARRYSCDTSDEQWAVLASVLPWSVWLDGGGGRPGNSTRRSRCTREPSPTASGFLGASTRSLLRCATICSMHVDARVRGGGLRRMLE